MRLDETNRTKVFGLLASGKVGKRTENNGGERTAIKK